MPEEGNFPCGHRKGGRNLIVCIDGTANQFGDKNTNVIELYHLILKEGEDNQCTWYNSGIGTYAQPQWKSPEYWEQVVVHWIDTAIAWNFDRTVMGAYEWLSDNYQEGDCIFLFGFSRGAFQVRTLSAMIDRVGLIHKGNKMQIPFAYELYRHSDSDHGKAAPVGSGQVPGQRTDASVNGVEHQQPASGRPSQEYVSKSERFKRAFSRKNVKVHFVGAWDTVSSIGIVRGKKMLPGTTDGMGHVCYFRQALALDERRVKFLPEYAWGGSTVSPTQHSDWKHAPCRPGLEKTVEEKFPPVLEVWFAGTHSDIGGGNAQNLGMDRSRPPLRWMVLEAVALGLRTAPFERELTSEQQIEFQESLTGIWRFLEWWPLRRLTFDREPNRRTTTNAPHRGRSRKIHWGQKIHSSLILANTPYNPKARPPAENGVQKQGDLSFWDQLREDGLKNSTGWLEIDIFDYSTARRIIRMLIAGEDGVVECLQEIATKQDCAQALYDEVVDTIIRWEDHEPSVEVKYHLLHHATNLLQGQSAKLQLVPLFQILHLFDELQTSDRVDYRRVAGIFMSQLVDGTGWPEVDSFNPSTARRIMRILIAGDPTTVLEFLQRIAAKKDCAQALYDEVADTIIRWEDHEPSVEVKYYLLHHATNLLQGQSAKLQLIPLFRILHLFDELQTSDRVDYREVAGIFLSQLVDGTGWPEIDSLDPSTARRTMRILIAGDPTTVLEFLQRTAAKEDCAQALYDEVVDTIVRWEDHEPSVEVKYYLLHHATNLLQGQSAKLQLIPLFLILHLFDELQTSDRVDYRKVAGVFLSQLVDGTEWPEVDSLDPSTARRIMRILIAEDSTTVLEFLQRTAAKEDCAQALYDEVVDTIIRWEDHEPSVEVKYYLLHHATNLLQGQSAKLQLIPLFRILHLLDELRTSDRVDYRKVAGVFLSQLVDGTGWLEIDSFNPSTAPRFLRIFIAGDSTVLEFLQRIAAKEDCAQALYDEVVDTIIRWEDHEPSVEVEYDLLHHAINLLKDQSAKLQLIPLLRIRHLLDDLRTSDRDDYKEAAEVFLSQLADGSCPLVLTGHTDKVWALAFSPDSERIFSGAGSGDPTIRIWDAHTGAQIGEPLQGHTRSVNSIAISPDGKRIVSGSADCTIRRWDIETRKQAGEPLRNHSKNVRSVVISPDGRRIVSGSYDHTIRIWDAETGTQMGEPLQGHTDCVESVAISPDGKRIVSGSDDKTIRIWDAETGAQVGEPLLGHTEWVLSVAISPDGKRIVSGSEDSTVRIWDIEAGEQLGELRGHTGWVYSVTLSHDGKHIISASGGQGKTVRIWDMEERTQVGEPLRGHTDLVFFVAISPDGKSIVSSSADKTIRIWNAEGILG